MNERAHDDVVRESFRSQVEAFSGPDSVYGRRETLVGWAGALDSSMVVLDAACGAAHVAESVAPFVRQVVGVDLTPELLLVGAERLERSQVENVLLQEGDVVALPFVTHSFDVAMCRASLHHFEDPKLAIGELVRVTKRGGRVVLVDLVAPPGVDRERFDHLHRLLDPSHVRTFVEEELVRSLPGGTAVTRTDTGKLRLPIDVAVSERSDRAAVVSALAEELGGGRVTGFEPAEEDAGLVVSFLNCVVHADVY